MGDTLSINAPGLGTFDPGSLTDEQQTKFGQALQGIFQDLQVLTLDESKIRGTAQFSSSGSDNSGQTPIPPPSNSMNVDEMVYLMGELSESSLSSTIDANIQLNNIMSQIQQQEAQATIDQVNQAAAQQAKSDQKSGIAKAFGWIVAIGQIVAGIALLATGAGAALGTALIVGGVISAVMQTKVGQDLMTGLVNSLSKVMPKALAEVTATLLITAIVIGCTLGAGAIAGAVEGAVSGVTTGLETAGETSLEEGSQMLEEGVEEGSNAPKDTAPEGETTGEPTGPEITSNWAGRAAQSIRTLQMQRLIAMADVLANIANATMGADASYQGLEAGLDEAQLLKLKGAMNETQQFIQMGNQQIGQELSQLNEAITSAAGVLAQMPSVVSSIFGKA